MVKNSIPMPIFFYIISGLADMLSQTQNTALLTLIHNIFRHKPDVKDLALESNSSQLKIPHT